MIKSAEASTTSIASFSCLKKQLMNIVKHKQEAAAPIAAQIHIEASDEYSFFSKSVMFAFYAILSEYYLVS